MHEESPRSWCIYQLCAPLNRSLRGALILILTGYERTNPDPNGDGRAQCAVGNDFDEPFNVTVYADDGSVYKVGPNEVSTPSPDYAGKGFFNNTFYPLGGGSGPDVGPDDLDGFCATDPAPNVHGNDGGSSTTGIVPSGSSVYSSASTGSASVPSNTPTVPYPTGTGTGYGFPTGGYGPSGSGYYAPSAPTTVAFTGDASSSSIYMGMFVFVGGVILMVVS